MITIERAYATSYISHETISRLKAEKTNEYDFYLNGNSSAVAGIRFIEDWVGVGVIGCLNSRNSFILWRRGSRFS